MRSTFVNLMTIGALAALASCQTSKKPNIMVIMVDDMGYSDPGCFGGEIYTPNIDHLADNGVRFTQFYNCSRCCPTRASLLTGQYQHNVGLAVNGESLTTNCVTIAEVLKEQGYQTGMTGKWHLTRANVQEDESDHFEWLANRQDFGDFGDKATYPCNRGFDEHYGIIWGVVNFFNPFSLVHNETPIKNLPDDFYMTDFVTEKSVELIERFSKSEKPFFMYVAHTAPHWPLHALPEDIEKYKGKYDKGWDALRAERYDRMVKMGLVNPESAPNAKNASNQKWADCEEKGWEAAHMEVHAAMVDRVDQGVGEILEKLRETGQLENTIIFFMSDNGASPERVKKPGYDRPAYTRDSTRIYYSEDKYARPGDQTTMAGIGSAWAGAINTPYRYWKAKQFHGGNASPFIVYWPKGLNVRKGVINNTDVAHVMDIMPTCLEIAEAEYPAVYKGNKIDPVDGKSLLPLLKGDTREGYNVLYWEHVGSKAIRKGDWKMTSLKGNNWQLFDLSKDITETKNLATKHPEKVQELKSLYMDWAEKMGTE